MLGGSGVALGTDNAVHTILVVQVNVVAPAVLLGNGVRAETVDETYAELVDDGHDGGLARGSNGIAVVHTVVRVGVVFRIGNTCTGSKLKVE